MEYERSTGPGRPTASVILMRTWNSGEAEMVRQILVSYGIPCQVDCDISQRVLPVGLSELRLVVPESRAVEATRLIAEHRREGLVVLRGGRREVRKAGRRRGRDGREPRH